MPIQVLVVKSRTKVKLDRDRRQTYLDRLTGRLEEIQCLLNTRRYKRRDYTWVQIEKARRGNPAKILVDVELSGEDGNPKLTFQLNQEKLAQAKAMDGRYLVGTNDYDLSALNAFQGQLIELLRFPDPAVYLRPLEAES